MVLGGLEGIGWSEVVLGGLGNPIEAFFGWSGRYRKVNNNIRWPEVVLGGLGGLRWYWII